MIRDGKCDLCQTLVEIPAGEGRAMFRGHTPEYCEGMTRFRLEMTERIVRSASEEAAALKNDRAWLERRVREIPIEVLDFLIARGVEVSPQVRADIRRGSWLPSDSQQREKFADEIKARQGRIDALYALGVLTPREVPT